MMILMSAERRRLPEVKTLYEILPKGTEGGKEFTRIVIITFDLYHNLYPNIHIYDVNGLYHKQ